MLVISNISFVLKVYHNILYFRIKIPKKPLRLFIPFYHFVFETKKQNWLATHL